MKLMLAKVMMSIILKKENEEYYNPTNRRMKLLFFDIISRIYP